MQYFCFMRRFTFSGFMKSTFVLKEYAVIFTIFNVVFFLSISKFHWHMESMYLFNSNKFEKCCRFHILFFIYMEFVFLSFVSQKSLEKTFINSAEVFNHAYAPHTLSKNLPDILYDYYGITLILDIHCLFSDRNLYMQQNSERLIFELQTTLVKNTTFSSYPSLKHP